MSSKRETILAAVKTALTGTSGVSTRIYRSRSAAFARQEYPALVLEPISDAATREAVGRLTWRLSFHVAVLVRADEADSAADPTVIDVHSKIMGDATLSSLLVDLVPASVDYQFFDGDVPLGVVTQQFQATYQTTETSIVS